MRRGWKRIAVGVALVTMGVAAGVLGVLAQGASTMADPSKSSYLSVNEEDFRTVFARMSAARSVAGV